MVKNIYQNAKLYRQNKDYSNAVQLYKELWEARGTYWDKWLGWEYAFTLKKLGRLDEAIYVCRDVFLLNNDFHYNNDLLAWCLYEKYLKFNVINSSALPKAIEIAEFITKITKQKGKSTAYEATVFRTIDILKVQNTINYNKILYWIEKLDYILLSTEVIIYSLGEGKLKEGASRREEYFSIKTKALEKLEKYLDCIKVCNIAFEDVTQFHFDNEIWIDVRKNYCICLTTIGKEFDSAIKSLIDITNKKKHWTIYYKVFKCYYKNSNYESAVVFGSKALLSNDQYDKKVSLLFEYGVALEKLGDQVNATKHFEFAYIIRKENSWTIPIPLEKKVIDYSLINSDRINKNLLKEFWVNKSLKNKELIKGTIMSILPHGKAGFIKTDSGESYYFRIVSIILGIKNLSVNKQVSFSLINSFDKKKQQETKEAIDIIVK